MAASPSQPYRVDWRNRPTDFDALNQGLSGVFDHADQMFQELYGRVARLAASSSTSGTTGARGPMGLPGFDGQDGEDGFLGYGRSPYGSLQALANGGTGTTTIFTAGSVVFAGVGGIYTQDNANLFWDDTNNRLGIGTTGPTVAVHVISASADVAAPSNAIVNIGSPGHTQALSFGTYDSNYSWVQAWNKPLLINPLGNNTILNRDIVDKVGIGTDAPATLLDVNGSITVRSTGVILTSLGSVSAPPYTFTGDPNTGMYSTFADRVAFTAGGFKYCEFINAGDSNINLQSGENFSFNVGGSSPGTMFFTASTAADAGHTKINPPGLTWQGRYWDGAASQVLTFAIQPMVDSTTPTRRIVFLVSGSEKVSINESGKVGIRSDGVAATAYLHIRAGSASANTAPIKLDSGTVLTTPEAGTIEYDGTNFYLTP